MKCRYLLLLTILLATMGATAQVTLPECLELAQQNYPLIKKYDLIRTCADIDIRNINRGWLPRLEAYGQGSWQNVVPAFPESLSGMMAQMGSEPMRGMDKWQYKAGVDLSQTVWDGGASKVRRAVSRADAERRAAAVEVDVYAVRERVESIYFGILLMDRQIEQTEATARVLMANVDEISIMVENGIAMQADADMLRAQYLAVEQQLVQARSARAGYLRMLEIFTGTSLQGKTLSTPTAEIPSDLSSARPELKLFSAVGSLEEARRSAVGVAAMPKIGVFAQAYYGYAGFDYFEAMNSRKPSFNFIGGVKVAWNIDALYTRSNEKKKIALEALETATDRETFLFNSDVQTVSLLEEIDGMRRVAAGDDDIVALRRSVRVAAEAQLEGGIIDATALLGKINDENQALIAKNYHDIQLLQTIYKLKNTLNR